MRYSLPQISLTKVPDTVQFNHKFTGAIRQGTFQNVKPLCYTKVQILRETEHNEDTQGSQEILDYTTSPF
jgi:hypothetical protein